MEAKANAKPGSMTAKANMVKDFNERNNKKQEGRGTCYGIY